MSRKLIPSKWSSLAPSDQIVILKKDPGVDADKYECKVVSVGDRTVRVRTSAGDTISISHEGIVKGGGKAELLGKYITVSVPPSWTQMGVMDMMANGWRLIRVDRWTGLRKWGMDEGRVSTRTVGSMVDGGWIRLTGKDRWVLTELGEKELEKADFC